MNIYAPIVITEQMIKSFEPCRLYIKELVGIKYFGKTTLNNVDTYTGSGKVWRNRIKKYGKHQIKTLWVSDWYYDPHEICAVALHFSEENDIVGSSEWANSKPENGLDGGFAGYKWYTRGTEERLSIGFPGDDWQLGRKNNKALNKGMSVFNNGIEHKYGFESPGEGWTKGMIPEVTARRKLPRGPYSEERKQSRRNSASIRKYKFVHPDHGTEFCSTGELVRRYPNLYRSRMFLLVTDKIEEFRGWKVIR